MGNRQGKDRGSKSIGVSIDAVLDEIDRLNSNRPQGFSVTEMSEETGHCVQWCRKKMRELIKSGRAEFVGNDMRPDITGRGCRVPVYRIVG